MVYRYSAYTLDRQVVNGTIDAASESLAEQALYRAGYQRVLRLKPAAAKIHWARWFPSVYGVKPPDVIDFSRQLALLLDSGIAMLTALRLLEGQAPSAALENVTAGLIKHVEEGSAFSQALRHYTEAFPDTYCQMVKAGELSGNLGLGVRQAADYLEAETAATKKVKSALAYPVMVLSLAIGVVLLLTLVALPPLVQLYNSLGGELPLLTRLMMLFGGFLIDYKFQLLGFLALLALFFVVFTRTPYGKAFTDGLLLKLPLVGGIIIQRSMSRFCLIAAMLLKTGLPLAQILSVINGAVDNTAIRRALEEVREKLVQGMGLSQPMADSRLFPRLLVEMILVGETTGTLDDNLATMAELYHRRVEQYVARLIAMIEPALIIAIGIVVMLIAMSMVVPLYSVLRTMG